MLSGNRLLNGSRIQPAVPIRNALLTHTPASAVIGFVLCTLPSIHYHVLLAATACFGATAFILGVDCYTTAGLKEVGFRVRVIPVRY
jgi:hypothetical protein